MYSRPHVRVCVCVCACVSQVPWPWQRLDLMDVHLPQLLDLPDPTAGQYEILLSAITCDPLVKVCAPMLNLACVYVNPCVSL